MAGVGCGGGLFRSDRVRPRCAHCRRGGSEPGRGEPNRSIRPSPPGFGAPNRAGVATEATAGGLPTLRGPWFQSCSCRHNPISVGQVALPWSVIPSASAGPGYSRAPGFPWRLCSRTSTTASPWRNSSSCSQASRPSRRGRSWSTSPEARRRPWPEGQAQGSACCIRPQERPSAAPNPQHPAGGTSSQTVGNSW